MTRLITSLAHLSDIRDRDRLETTVASVLFELIGPLSLSMYRVVEHAGSLRVRTRVQISAANPLPLSDAVNDAASLPALEACERLAACHASAKEASFANADGTVVFILPVHTEVTNVGFLELHCRKGLSVYQRRMIDGMLRIYYNYIQILNASLYDQLTGLLNRRTFDEQLFALLSHRNSSKSSNGPVRVDRRQSEEGPSWLAVLDVDHFKRINDRFGHQYGDEVLVLLAQLLRQSFREHDRIFRFGGEEFVVVLAAAPFDAVAQIMERCRATTEGYSFPQVGRVTISIGYTMLRLDDTGSAAFGRADEALYAAKEQGRNRALLHEALVANGQAKSISSKQSDIEFFS